jgi:acetolactate synthase-1/2/3 large subunit
LKAVVIEDQRDLATAVRGVLEMPGPVLCDVRVVPDEARAPRMTSLQLPDGSFVSKPLEDMWPLLDRDEFASNMLVDPVTV